MAQLDAKVITDTAVLLLLVDWLNGVALLLSFSMRLKARLDVLFLLADVLEGRLCVDSGVVRQPLTRALLWLTWLAVLRVGTLRLLA